MVRRHVLRLDDSVVRLVDGLAFAGRGEVQRVDDPVLLQAFVHLVHLLADGVDDILLVLTPGLFVRSHLFLLTAFLEANDDHAGHDGDQRDGRRNGGDHDDLGDRQRSVRGHVAQAGSAAEHSRCRCVEFGRGSRALASQTRVAARADALVFVDSVDASGAVEARPARALVHFLAAIFAGEARLASATEVIH